MSPFPPDRPVVDPTTLRDPPESAENSYSADATSADAAASYIDALLERDPSSQLLAANNESTARQIYSREQEVKAIYERLFREGEHFRGIF